MLAHLQITDLLLIDQLEIGFHPGLNVLTGETGSGKSILLDCLGLALGWRGRAETLRPGASSGEVLASFRLASDHPARAALAEFGLPAAEDGLLLLRRQIGADGRRNAWVNDRRATTEALRALADTLVELHGQHDDRGLLNPRGHRALLDAFGNAEAELAAVRRTWQAFAAARARLEAARATLEAARRDEAFLRHACTELARLAPRPGEEAALDTRRRQMQAAQRIRADVARALAGLTGDGSVPGAEDMLLDAQRRLEAAAATVGFAAGAAEGSTSSGTGLEVPLAALGRAMIEVADAQAGIEACLGALDADPAALEAAEERLFAIRALARKHGVAPDELADLAEGLRAQLAALDQGEGALKAAARAEAAAAQAHAEAAQALGARRQTVAARLDAAVAAELGPLRLEKTRFLTHLTPSEPGPEGSDEVRFLVATNPGLDPGPLERIASGGEQGRLLLALKVCLAADRPGQTLILDEIDRGVGGATADAVGRRLARLAGTGQVLVVTHSPQVAARGAHHLRVAKIDADGALRVQVHALGTEARVDEIARMLAGDRVTDAARAAARALIGD